MTRTAYRTTLFALFIWVSMLGSFSAVQAGVITITQRESRGNNKLFAGSGGAVQQQDPGVLFSDLTGSFGFSDTASVSVTETDSFSSGAADAFGSISITDNIVQSSPSTLVLTATRTASGTANWTAGTGNGTSSQSQTFRVRFTTGSDPVSYSLTGSFDPGNTATGTGKIVIIRPFTTLKPVSITTATPVINETGTLLANNTFQLFIKMNDNNSASAGSPSASDASSLNIVLTLQSIPEPATLSLFALGGVATLLRRRHSA